MTIEDLDPRGSTPVQPPEVVGTSPQKPTSASRQSEGLPCVALYPYNSEEAGDLSFEVMSRFNSTITYSIHPNIFIYRPEKRFLLSKRMVTGGQERLGIELVCFPSIMCSHSKMR